jgi:hypothetical protein
LSGVGYMSLIESFCRRIIYYFPSSYTVDEANYDVKLKFSEHDLHHSSLFCTYVIFIK